MTGSHRFQGTVRYIHAHWPGYSFVYVGIILSLIGMAVGARNGWTAFVPLGMALLILQFYFLFSSLWAAHKLHDPDGLRPHHVLYQMAGVEPWESFAFIDLGSRELAMELAGALTTGCIFVVDVHNPHWTPSRALSRKRNRAPAPVPDPRLEWYSSEITLLPFPDRSVKAVILCQVLSEFWQYGDRLALLKELKRILSADGRIVVAEQARSQINWLVKGPAALRLPTPAQWRALLSKSGLRVLDEKDLSGLIHCFTAAKRSPPSPRQLALELVY